MAERCGDMESLLDLLKPHVANLCSFLHSLKAASQVPCSGHLLLLEFLCQWCVEDHRGDPQSQSPITLANDLLDLYSWISTVIAQVLAFVEDCIHT